MKLCNSISPKQAGHLKPLPPLSRSSSPANVHFLPLPPRAPGMTTHAYSLRSSSGFVSLALNSLAAGPDKLPVINANQPVTGEVTLELSSLPTLKDVLITIHGKMHAAGSPPTVFLSHTLSLFNPALPQPAPETSTIDGTHTLPFQLWLPAIGANGLPLPPSWSSALSPATKIEYTVSLSVRPKRSNSHFPAAHHHHHHTPDNDTLDVPITFVPRVRASEKSPPLAWSATEGTAGSWPRERDAWHLSTANLRGSQFGVRDAPLRATLGLASPLAYPIHSSIPFTLTLADDAHTAPDVLAAPIAISVDLRRAVRYVPVSSSLSPTTSGACGSTGAPPLWCKLCRSHRCKCGKRAQLDEAARSALQEWTWETIAQARCWQVPHSSRYVRIVRGEIDLSAAALPAVEPSFEFGGLAVSYAVHVRFSAPAQAGKMGGREEGEHFTFVEPVALVSDPAGWEPSRTSVYASTTSPSSSSKTPASPPPPSEFTTSDEDAPPSYDLSQRLSFSPPPTPPYTHTSTASTASTVSSGSRSGSVRFVSEREGRARRGRARKARSAERPGEEEMWVGRMREDDGLLA